jgi:phosphatidylserine/phosphatidylglycerophosphate/cardiolipin synthase-like enzyme
MASQPRAIRFRSSRSTSGSLRRELYRPKNDGFVFFVHTKFLLIDPLSDDPLVCSGSANFSPDSLLQNDENMLLIRGDTRVADIYMTEFDRVFRHFYFRDIANELAATGDQAAAIFLDDRQLFQARQRENQPAAHVLPPGENDMVRQCRYEVTKPRRIGAK